MQFQCISFKLFNSFHFSSHTISTSAALSTMLMTSSISSSSLRTSPSSLLPCLNQTTFSYSNSKISSHFISTPASRKHLAPLSKLRISSSENNRSAVDVVSPPPTTSNADGDDGGGADVVRRFYDGINGRDLASVEELIADDCVYEDLIFPRPFLGRKVTNAACACHVRCPKWLCYYFYYHFFTAIRNLVLDKFWMCYFISDVKSNNKCTHAGLSYKYKNN